MLGLAVAVHVERHLVARVLGAHVQHEVAGGCDVLAVELRDDVALLQAGFGRAGAFADGRHVGAFVNGQAVALGVLRVHGGEGHAELRMGRGLAVDDLLGEVHRVVHRDGEADAGVVAGVRRDQRVDADELAVRVDERAAGVTGVDSGVSLDHIRVDGGFARAVAVLIGGGVHDLRTARGRHDAGGNGLLEAERAADGHDPLADDELVGVADLDGRKAAGILGLDDRDVGAGIAAHDLGVVGLARDGDLVRAAAFYDVVVRDDVAVGGEHDAASQRGLRQRAGFRSVAGPKTVHAARIGLVRVHIDGGHGGKRLLRDSLCQRLVGLGVGSVDAAGVLRTQLRRRRRGSGIVTARSGLPDAEAAQTDGAGDGGTAEGEQERASAVRLLLDGHSSCRMLRVLRLLIVLLLLLIIRLLPHGGGMLGMLVALRRRHGAVAGGAAMRIGHVLHAPSIRAGL